MSVRAYYNDDDDYVCRWLNNLIGAGLIAPGYVDNRSITEVHADDLRGFTQCHFFAGIGVWSYALRLAGWPDDRPIWTGSCPCQPFSGAGKRGGISDDRHLWPVWFDLIRQRRPCTILGEQVASKDGLGWWDIVSADLEREAYPTAALDLCVPGVGGPHMRQRLYWMAYALHAERRPIHEHGKDGRHGADGGRQETHGNAGSCGEVRGLADSSGPRLEERQEQLARGELETAKRGRHAGGLGNAESLTRGLPDGPHGLENPQSVGTGEADRTSPLNGFWRDADWLNCIDGKWRPVEPGTFPLAHGAAARVGRLRAYGNAINAAQAAQFIQAVMEVRP